MVSSYDRSSLGHPIIFRDDKGIGKLMGPGSVDQILCDISHQLLDETRAKIMRPALSAELFMSFDKQGCSALGLFDCSIVVSWQPDVLRAARTGGCHCSPKFAMA